ncbi:MAG TPA: sigma-70 family RNA polymerase sigma factor [Ohtaekwangia sp.]|nr:sigma-70 family RNA polymerase sigma factor [Ohtaekwangia sp.]
MNTYQHLNDSELVTLLVNGNKLAFHAIYQRYLSDLFRYVRKNISCKEDCEEIIQEIFESLWVRHKELGHVTGLRAYLFQMVKYKVIRYFRHHSVRKKYAEHYRFFEAMYDNMSEQEKGSDLVQAVLERSVSTLPDRCQEAVKLRLIENFSNADIARKMNISRRTVENYITAALRFLRAYFRNFKIAIKRG